MWSRVADRTTVLRAGAPPYAYAVATTPGGKPYRAGAVGPRFAMVIWAVAAICLLGIIGLMWLISSAPDVDLSKVDFGAVLGDPCRDSTDMPAEIQVRTPQSALIGWEGECPLLLWLQYVRTTWYYATDERPEAVRSAASAAIRKHLEAKSLQSIEVHVDGSDVEGSGIDPVDESWVAVRITFFPSRPTPYRVVVPSLAQDFTTYYAVAETVSARRPTGSATPSPSSSGTPSPTAPNLAGTAQSTGAPPTVTSSPSVPAARATTTTPRLTVTPGPTATVELSLLALARNLRIGTVVNGDVGLRAVGHQPVVLVGVTVQMVYQRGIVERTVDVDIDPDGVPIRAAQYVVVWPVRERPDLGCLAEIRILYSGSQVTSATAEPGCRLGESSPTTTPTRGPAATPTSASPATRTVTPTSPPGATAGPSSSIP